MREMILWLPLITAGTAAVMDLRSMKVDNGWLLLCWALGGLLTVLRAGPAAALGFFWGSLVPLLLLGGFYVFHMIGAGDIKLLCVLGGMLGAERILRCCFFTFLIGGAISLALLFSCGLWQERLSYLLSYLDSWRRSGVRGPYIQKGPERPENIHLTIPVFLSVLLVCREVFI